MAAIAKATSSPKMTPTHHFGRGGAGNKTAKDPSSPAMVPASTPVLKEAMYTTGRGGSGNMAKNDFSRPEEARAAQDVDDIPEMSLPDGPRAIGRGGAANMYLPTDDEKLHMQQNNERGRSESTGKDKLGLKSLAEKGKDLLTGSKKKE